jgi:hypothetical protein
LVEPVKKNGKEIVHDKEVPIDHELHGEKPAKIARL